MNGSRSVVMVMTSLDPELFALFHLQGKSHTGGLVAGFSSTVGMAVLDPMSVLHEFNSLPVPGLYHRVKIKHVDSAHWRCEDAGRVLVSPAHIGDHLTIDNRLTLNQTSYADLTDTCSESHDWSIWKLKEHTQNST